MICPENKVSDVEYWGQGRRPVSGVPPSEWVGATRVSTHRKEMGERKQLGKRMSSLSASPGGPFVLARGGGTAGSQEKKKGGMLCGRLAPLKVVGSQQALW